MLSTFHYRLYPSTSQSEALSKAFGSCRFVYNKALEHKINKYNKEKVSVSYNELSSSFLLSLKSEFIFLKDIPSQALQQSLRHLDSAYKRFFKFKKGFPNFKSKYSKQSFSVPQNVKVNFKHNTVYIPKIGNIKTRLHRHFDGIIKTCTISKSTSNKYYISILVEDGKQLPKFIMGNNLIGIDLGIKHFATYSDGTKIPNPKFYHKHLEKLKRLQSLLSQKKKGSNNYKKLKLIIARLHDTISNSRENFLHQLSSKIISNNHVIFLETLDVKSLMEKSYRSLSRNFGDVALSKFITYLKYKSERYGKKVLQIGKYVASSKICNKCRVKNEELKLEDREWKCSSCGTLHDRDVNAGINVLQFGQELPEFKALLVP